MGGGLDVVECPLELLGGRGDVADDFANLSLKLWVRNQGLKAFDRAVEADDHGADIGDGAIGVVRVGVIDSFRRGIGQKSMHVFGDGGELGGEIGEILLEHMNVGEDVFGDESAVRGLGGKCRGAVVREVGAAGVGGVDGAIRRGAHNAFSEVNGGVLGDVDTAVDGEDDTCAEGAVETFIKDHRIHLTDIDAVEIDFSALGEAIGVGSFEGDSVGPKSAGTRSVAQQQNAVHHHTERYDNGDAHGYIFGLVGDHIECLFVSTKEFTHSLRA